MTLAEFVLARIAEDEEAAQAAPTDGALIWRDDDGWVSPPWSKVRVLAECEAKRRIVVTRESFAEARMMAPEVGSELAAAGAVVALDVALKMLAMPYADHPDYRQEWKP